MQPGVQLKDQLGTVPLTLRTDCQYHKWQNFWFTQSPGKFTTVWDASAFLQFWAGNIVLKNNLSSLSITPHNLKKQAGSK